MAQLISAEPDEFGQRYVTSAQLCDLLYSNPKIDLSGFLVLDAEEYNRSAKQLHYSIKPLKQYQKPTVSVNEFDQKNQGNWYMPDSYKTLDIADWLLKKCSTEAELQRVAQELILYQERGLFPLLRFMKYLVDTLRANNLVWGVGRGSSVASYVLYLLDVHRINSIYYDLDIAEFLK